MKYRAKSKRSGEKRMRPVTFEFHLTAVLGAVGLILGFLAEVIWRGTMLWMTAGGLLGGAAGILCDTALFVYRRRRRAQTKR